MYKMRILLPDRLSHLIKWDIQPQQSGWKKQQMLLSVCQFPPAKDQRGVNCLFRGMRTTRTTGHLNSSTLKGTQRLWALVRGLGAGSLRKQGFVVDWRLSGSGGDFMIRYLNNSYLEGRKTRARWKLKLVKKQQSLLIGRIEGYLVISVVGQCADLWLCSEMRRNLSFYLDPLWPQSEWPCRCWWPVKLFTIQGLAEGQASPWIPETAFLFLTSHQVQKKIFLSFMFRIEKRENFKLITSHSNWTLLKYVKVPIFNKANLLNSLALSSGRLLKHRCEI